MVRRTTRRDRRKKQHHDEHGSLLWIVLMLGVCFCMIDVLYLFFASHYQTVSYFESSNNFVGVIEKRIGLINDNRKSNEEESSTTDTAKTEEDFKDKERIFEIIRSSGIGARLEEEGVKEKLPTWDDVVNRLGPGPRIYGLESCKPFRDSFGAHKDALKEAFLGIAGTFNSGTNLLAELLLANCENDLRQKFYGGQGVRWQVNWGKHTPPKRWRYDKEIIHASDPPNDHMLPVVSIRDPYTWLQSMCVNRYATHWFHEVNFHCPNFIPNHVEHEFYPKALDGSYKRTRQDLHHKNPWLVDNIMNTANFTLESKTVPVYVKYKRETMNHESLAHMWNEWYRQYYDADFPRLIVRYEDLVFYGKEVTETACSCFGGKMKHPNKFQYIGDSAKHGDIHMNKTSLLDNMYKFSSSAKPINLTKGMTEQDIKFVRDTLDHEMMEFFNYHHPIQQ